MGDLVYCSKCGQPNPETSNYCTRCGTPLVPTGIQGRMRGETATGLEPDVAGALCYALWWLTGIAFLVMEREDRFVRFHALQSVFAFGAISLGLIVLSALGTVTYAFVVIRWLVLFAAVLLWLWMMIKAFIGERFKLPWVGDLAEKHC